MSAAAHQLETCLGGSTVLVGIGNRWRRDDGAGPLLMDRVAGKVRARCIDAGDAPERHLGEALHSRPETIILVDAVDFGGSPGEIAVFGGGDLPARLGTTHDVPLRVLMGYLAAEGRATVLLVGIQPASVGFGEGVSAPVEASVEALADLLEARLQGSGQATSAATGAAAGPPTARQFRGEQRGQSD
jgi:hydrogenase 3 maturation protease